MNHISNVKVHLDSPQRKSKNLRNEFDFWNVHGIMNTLGLLQNFAKDPKYS